MFIPYHQHLIVKAYCKNPIRKESILNKWFIELVKKVGMVVVAGPTSFYVEEEGNEGITGTVTLATSHASIHIWDEKDPAMLQFDIYSCKKYELETVIEHLNEMDLISYNWMMIDRNNDLQVIDSGSKIIEIDNTNYNNSEY
jgi:S-adenosylmethionine/arginine decarboxylase-like enzyme